MEGLFDQENTWYQLLDMPQAEVYYYPDFLEPNQQKKLFDHLKKQVNWQQDNIKVFGKIYAQPRLTALFADNEKSYTYSSITMHPALFPTALLELKQKIEQKTKCVFTTCLLNLYRDGQDSNGWHADDEKELGKNPIIASVSLGAPRFFKFRDKKNKADTRKILLEPGSLLLMKGSTQHHWQHQVPKTAKQVGERINLTFRKID
ncbi:alpha-ketoglutarate-dependent dioxygenase AlkB family protein [Flavimarina sp. Hel_I_48]|uniref:alpha-ketoglutarate-dependent dioxygenase AlkB family protein n=1 Tax=Flavimarina sp. Hel_I_48 TaxID=1392488 RepID=UPI0004DF25E2|nr:alpha-ketoglutarate-dependent dioxygenase AlkB [Flavimarina sp. Hel_I_48]